MAQESLSEIVEACNEMSTEELAEPSLESANAYAELMSKRFPNQGGR